ncbi:MAG: hypothetical protein ABGZ35_10990 [Planctomycetaceae bacterium]
MTRMIGSPQPTDALNGVLSPPDARPEAGGCELLARSVDDSRLAVDTPRPDVR